MAISFNVYSYLTFILFFYVLKNFFKIKNFNLTISCHQIVNKYILKMQCLKSFKWAFIFLSKIIVLRSYWYQYTLM